MCHFREWGKCNFHFLKWPFFSFGSGTYGAQNENQYPLIAWFWNFEVLSDVCPQIRRPTNHHWYLLIRLPGPCVPLSNFRMLVVSPLMKQLQFDDTSKIDIRYTLQRIVTKQEHTLEGTAVSMFSIYYIKQIFALTIKFKDRHKQDCCQTPCSPCCFLCKRLRSQDCYRLPGGMMICRNCICKGY